MMSREDREGRELFKEKLKLKKKEGKDMEEE